ncbi:hypothetical protein SPLA10_PHROGS00170 [Salmonella phage SPLA10]|nr:hypothetical protein SPLA10_PHROGS00170 [Salmonella phage SPLA10]
MLTLIAAGVMVGSGLFIAGYALGRHHVKPIVGVEQLEVMHSVNEGRIGNIVLGDKRGDFEATGRTYLTKEEFNQLKKVDLTAEDWELSSAVDGLDITLYHVTGNPDYAGKIVLTLYVRGDNARKYKWENVTSSKNSNVLPPVTVNSKYSAIRRVLEATLEAELRKY